MRYRTNNTLTQTYGTLTTTTCANATSTSTRLSPKSGNDDESFDVVTPNYLGKIAKGIVINNPFESYKRTYSYGGAGSYTRNRIGTCTGSTTKTETGDYMLTATEGVLPRDPSWLIDVNNLTTLALTEAYANVAPADIQSMVSIAEMRKTIGMIRKPLASMQRIYDTATRRRRGRSDVGNDASSTWLEVRYGWLPLMYDVEGVLKAISRDYSERYVARGSQSGGTTSSETRKRSGLLTHYDFDIIELREESVQVRAGVLYAHDLKIQEYSKYGATLSQVPAAAWELIPFSFVVDWFANVGDFVGAIIPQAGTSTLAAWTSVKREQVWTRTISNFKLGSSLSGSYTLSANPNGHWDRCVYNYYHRQTRSRSDIGLRFDLNLTDKRVVDALALLTQRLR